MDPFSTSVPSHILRLGCYRAKRHLVWNPGNGSDRTTEHLERNLSSDIIDKSSPTALLALVTQIAGEWALVPCTSCRGGLGDWARCVIPPPAQGGITSWACANCVRREDGQGCSLRSGTRETYPAKSSSHADTGAAALDSHLLAAEDRDHDSFAGAAAASTEHSDDVSIAMETGSTSSTGSIGAKCGTSPSCLGLDPGPDPEEVQLGGQTRLAEEDCRAFENNDVDAALRIEFDRGDIAVMEAGKLLREPLMTLEELEVEIRGWYE
ncbi:hypothetical protein EsDP_00002890 [Epichloe bromicola]|uniref:Uncharacterized protein n=1 Tax=Epichloe bromicola TaxID=79588 RepID=A0ABQ0CM57_9HYPO